MATGSHAPIPHFSLRTSFTSMRVPGPSLYGTPLPVLWGGHPARKAIAVFGHLLRLSVSGHVVEIWQTLA